MKVIVPLLALFLLCFNPIHAQEDYVRFNRITINDGLSLSSVYTIYQDSKGFIWFGTEDGLNKYDGRTITVFGGQGDEKAKLSNKWIEIIYEDKTGMIWLGTRGGLTRYNPRSGVFTPFYKQTDDTLSLSSDTITAIASDIRNNIWVGTNSGLNLVERFTSEVHRVVPDSPELAGLCRRINGLSRDESGNLWIATQEGLFTYDGKSGLFFNESKEGILDPTSPIYRMDLKGRNIYLLTDKGIAILSPSHPERERLIPLPNRQNGENVHNFLATVQGDIWLVDDHGLRYCKPGGSEFIRIKGYRGSSTHSLALDPAEPLLEDMHGNIWMGTFGNGVYKVNPSDLSIKHYMHNPGDPESLSENSIHSIFEDRSGALWFGTFGAGVSIMNPHLNRFTLHKNNPFSENSLVSSFVWTICEGHDSVLWVGTDAKGISTYNMKTGNYSHFTHNPFYPLSSLSHVSVRKIYQDSKDRVWVGTDGGGLNLFEPETGTFSHLKHNPRNVASISNNSVRAIYEDPKGRLWVGTRNGLNLLEDDRFFTFKHYLLKNELAANDPEQAPSPHFIYSAIYLDRNDQLWVGSYGGGLIKLDPETGEYEQFYLDPDNPNSLSDNIVFSIHEDENGRFWIGTNSGLNMFYPATGSFRRFGTKEGLANEVIYGILPDEKGRLWLSTNRGIIRFDPETFEVKNYSRRDGLQSNEFNGGAYHKGGSGQLYFGGVYGLNVLNPGELTPMLMVPDVTLTRLEVMGKEVLVAGVEQEELFKEEPGRIVEWEEEFYSRENITYMEKIELDYKHRFFSVEFAALNNLQQSSFTYSYIMENLDEDWNQAGSRNYVTYSNMKAGTYHLKVLAENEDGYRGTAPMQLTIVIKAPFWYSWWFILLEIIVVSALVILLYTYLLKSRTNRLLKKQNAKIRETNEALRRSEKNLQELNATKDKLFSIISHDLKNPFSSLLSISELMVGQFEATEKEDHRAGFDMIHQSARQMLDLVENLLTWSQAQRGRIEFQPVTFQLDSLLQENMNLHKVMAQEKGIQLLLDKEKECQAYGDRDMVNTVVRNLVSNAIKFTGKGKKVILSLENGGEEVKVLVRDEGIGMEEPQLKKLFRMDEKLKSIGTAGEKGTGLGLLICKEFIEQNGGSISVESKPGEGSLFRFSLPASPPALPEQAE